MAKVTGGAPNKLSKMCASRVSPYASCSRFGLRPLHLQQGCPPRRRAGVDGDPPDAEDGAAGSICEQGAGEALPRRCKLYHEISSFTPAPSQKYLPLDLRKKQTRAIRRRLTNEQKNKKTEKSAKVARYFPLRRFAVKA